MTVKIRDRKSSFGSYHRHKPKGVSHKSFSRVYWPYLPIIFVSVFLSFGSYGSVVASKISHPSGHVLAYATTMSIRGLLRDTNNARAANGVAPLSINMELDASAQAKAKDMVARDYWSHNTPDGSPPWVFVDAQGYTYQKLGENLATGFSDEQSVINGWMASPPHRENLLDPVFTDVGFGFANIDNYKAIGGGPMTIIVSHYGKPAAQAKQSILSTGTTKSSSGGQSSSNSLSIDVNHGSVLAGTSSSSPQRTSFAQSVLTNMSFAKLATYISSFIMFCALGLWISKHLPALKRTFLSGEAFVVNHPIIDGALFVLAALGIIMSQTVGYIL